ncbi:MAG: fimbrial protein [Bacteroidales bacterium]|nr:fimbrial protein [Bacteroidales bacterium]
MKTSNHLLLLTATLALVTSCSMERMLTGPDSLNKEDANLTLRIRARGSQTRALTFAEENTINDVYVLVFDKTNQLVSIKEGRSVTSSPGHPNPDFSGEGSFVITLAQSKNTLDTYKLVVLANAEAILENTIGFDVSNITNRNYPNVMAKIYDQIVDKMYPSGGTVPMWGQSEALYIEPGNNNQTVQLLRAIARIDAGVGARSYNSATQMWSWDGMDATNNLIPFTLAHVYVIRPNNRYAVAPDITKAVDEPTIPSGTTAFSVTDSKIRFAYATPNGYTTQDIYIPESDIKMGTNGTSGDLNHKNRTALVLGGYYKGSTTESFYRVDFLINKNLINILRNHLYQISITGVIGGGYEDVETAYESIPMNMIVEIYEWDEMNMSEIIFDGMYYMMLQNSRNENRDDRTAVVYRNIASNDVIVFRTNIPLSKLAMELSDGGHFPNPMDKTVIENDRFRVEIKEENGVTFFLFTSKLPYGTLDNPSTLTITASRIKFDITILQRDAESGDWIDGGDYGTDF